MGSFSDRVILGIFVCTGGRGSMRRCHSSLVILTIADCARVGRIWHIQESQGFGFQVKVVDFFEGVPSWLDSGYRRAEVDADRVNMGIFVHLNNGHFCWVLPGGGVDAALPLLAGHSRHR